MQETDEEGQLPGLGERLSRVERELRAQRTEMAALRAEILQLKDDGAVGDVVFRTSEPEPPLVAPSPPPPRPQPAPPPLPAPAAPAGFNMFSDFKEPGAKLEAHRSVENRIGSQWFSRIGIVALLIGVALFLKFAYENHWIHPTATDKVIAGLLVGAAVVLWSERFRRKGYDAFSFSLKAVGTGTLYLTLWASFQMYHLLPAGVALAMMIGVTAWNAIMAWAQNSELLAVYALVGGFATPALLGTGGNHEIFLFTYVLAMDVAVLFLLFRKPWQRLLLGSFPATVIYFAGWYIKFFTADQAGLTGLFAVLLAAPFVAVALIGKQREDTAEGVLAPLSAASFLSCTLYSVLQDSGRHAWLPWFAVGLAAVYLLLMRLRRGGVAEAMHLALAIVFLTVAIPLKAEGRWIAIGWLAEGVALLWVAAKLLGPRVEQRVHALIRWLGFMALVLGVASALCWPWLGDDTLRAFLNRTFATEMLAAAALAAAIYLGLGMEDEDSRLNGNVIAAISMVLFNLVLLIAMHREIFRYFESGQLTLSAWGSARADSDFAFSAWMMLQAAALLAIGFWRRSAFVRWQGLALLVFTIGKVFLYDTRNLSSGYRVLSFIGLGALLMTVSFAYQKDWLRLREDDPVEDEVSR